MGVWDPNFEKLSGFEYGGPSDVDKFGTSERSRRIPEAVETGFSGVAPDHVLGVFRGVSEYVRCSPTYERDGKCVLPISSGVALSSISLSF